MRTTVDPMFKNALKIAKMDSKLRSKFIFSTFEKCDKEFGRNCREKSLADYEEKL